MAIIWVDIWNVQSSNKAKELINRYFNVRSYITTVRGANMNLGVFQCKNCWKWGHLMFSCKIQEAKYIKCNGSYKSKHHCQFVWYYKANKKTNPPRLETKKSEPCSHTFKCSNCWGKHQANLNTCFFWKHCFNHNWHNKKQQELCKSRSNSICSAMSGAQDLLTEHSKEQLPYQHYTQNTLIIWYYLHSRTILVSYINHLKLFWLWGERISRSSKSSELDHIFLGILCKLTISLVLSLTSIFVFPIYIFLFEMTFLTIKTFHAFLFSITVPFTFLLMYILICLNQLWSISRILKLILITSLSWLKTLILGIVFGIQATHIILLIKTLFFEITNSFHVELSKPTEFFPTRYSNNAQDSNLVLDLVFLCLNSMEYNNHCIHPEWRLTSNHASITVDISILKEWFQTRKQFLPKNSEEKAHFINELIYSIKSLNTDSLLSIDTLKTIV